MSSAFPNMFPNEPPPLDFDDEDDTGDGDYAEYTSRGLRLDILGEPSPQSSPQRKLPVVPAPPDKDKIIPKDDQSPTVPENQYATINGSSGHEPDKILDEERVTPDPYTNSTQTIENDCSLSPTIPTKYSSEESSCEEQDDFGDFRSSEFGETNILPELPLSNSNPPNHNDSAKKYWKAPNGLQAEISTPVGEEEIVTQNEERSDRNSISVPLEQSSSPPVELEDDNDFKDFQTQVVEIQVNTSSIPVTSANELEDDFGDFSNVQPSPQEHMSSVSPSVELDDDEFGDFSSEIVHVPEKLLGDILLPQKSSLLDDDFEDFASETNVVQESVSRLFTQTDEFEDDDFGDFCSNSNVTPRASVFEPPAAVSTNLPPLPLRTTLIGSPSSQDMEFEEIPPVPARVNKLEKINSTEFSPAKHSATGTTTTSSSNVAADPAFAEDFGDFLSSEQTDQVTAPVKFTRKDSQMETRFDSLVSSVFDQPSTIPANSLQSNSLRHIDKELEGKANHAWSHIQDFEDSHGLKFKWLNSIAHRHLLSSLKVDSSTILYSGKWGTIEVPKFAAHLADIPLQPLQPLQPELSSTPLKPSSSPSSDFQEFQSHKPVTNVNNSNENHPSTQNTFKETKISEETLAQISDLSSCMRTTRTEELVFPSTPMFNE